MYSGTQGERTDILRQYTRAAIDSSDRSRRILIVMIIASILVFTGFWNSRSRSWVKSRLDLAKATVDFLEGKEFPPGEEDLYERARNSALSAPKMSLEQARTNLMWLQKIRAEQLSVINVPVLGIAFDVNDLGMLGGFSFVVLLIWFSFSLWHHSNNLRLTFDLARELDPSNESRLLYFTYQNLAMQQVLTVPPSAGLGSKSQENGTGVWRLLRDVLRDAFTTVPKLLYALPLLVQSTVVAYDWSTYALGWAVNPATTRVVTRSGSLFCFLVLILTILCYRTSGRITNTWKKVARELTNRS